MYNHTHNPYKISISTTLTGASFSTNQELMNTPKTPKHSDNLDRVANRTRASAVFKEIKCESIPASINTRKQLHNNIRKAIKALQADHASINRRKQLHSNIPKAMKSDHAANSFSIMATTDYNFKPIPPRSVFLYSGFLKLPERASKEERKPQSMPIYDKSFVPASNLKMYI